MNFHMLGSGRIVYPLMFTVYSLFIVVETYVALTNPAAISLILFNVCNVWGAFNALKGWAKHGRMAGRPYVVPKSNRLD